MSSDYPKGSEWRKWDLQVQTRIDQNYTCLANGLSPENLLDLMAACGLTEAEITSQEKSMTVEKYAQLFVHYVGLFTDIKVVAITDHNSGKELDQIMDAAANSPYDLTILPGVEVASSHGIHILCIFDPLKGWRDTWASSIDHFLTEIGLTGNRFNPRGQPMDSAATSQHIIELVARKGGVSIFAHIGTSRGLFMQSNTANGGNAHVDIYKHEGCQIVQIPHSGNLSAGTMQIINGRDPQYGKKRVTQIKCSDARKLSNIGKQFTWIKADPTLEGLKQTIYEPDLRVKLQPMSPAFDSNKLSLINFKIGQSRQFKLADQDIPFNRDLVAIIGGRGSGKSLLLETIAAMNEEHETLDHNGKFKVIESHRRSGADATLTATLKNKDNADEPLSKKLSELAKLDLPILYIGQEKLSSIATDDEKLTPTIRSFLGIESDTIESGKIESTVKYDLAQIEQYTSIITALEKKYERSVEPGDKPFLDKLINFRAKKEKQIERLTSDQTKELVTKLRDVIDQGQKVKTAFDRLPILEEELKNLAANKAIDSVNDLLSQINAKTVTIPALDVTAQQQAITSATTALTINRAELAKSYKDITSKLKTLGVKEDMRLLTEGIRKLQDEINDIGTDMKTYTNAQLEAEAYREELKATGLMLKNLVEGRVTKINDAFRGFVNSNDLSDASEQELFNSIIEGVGVEGEIVFDEPKFVKLMIDECFDGRAVKDVSDIRRTISGGNKNQPITFADFVDFWQSGKVWPLLDQEKFNKYGRERFVDIIFNRWHDYVAARTKIGLNNVPIENLSVGQRGTLLLKIYLASATDKQIFIIDQPEDNLDNKFISDEMVPMLRKIKQSRQVILSTHNANIVVRCDADQVIVARLDETQAVDRLYITGSIENKRINHYIQTILEGGSKALADRYRRYM